MHNYAWRIFIYAIFKEEEHDYFTDWNYNRNRIISVSNRYYWNMFYHYTCTTITYEKE